MDEKIYQIAEQITQLHQKSYDVYLPLVEDVCSRIVSEDELAHLLDYLLDFACDEKILELYKMVCRRYLYVYSDCIKFYIEAHREMWGDEDKDVKSSLDEMELLSQLEVQQLQTLETISLNSLPKFEDDSQ